VKRTRALVTLLFADMRVSAALAQGLDVDWKLYGGAPVGGESLCFYDAKGLTRQPDGHIRVWTKCLLKTDLDAVNIEKDFDGRIVNATAEKVARYYVPPISKIQNVDANEAMAITSYEEIADIAAPHRSSYRRPNRGRDKPIDWKYVPPEGNGAALLKILCPS
jgi:hypothetical protein